MKFKIFTIFLIFSFNISYANTLYEPNTIRFKEGFEAGLQALEFQAKQDGYKQKQIEVSKPFLLVYEIKNTPLNEALFLEIIAQKEGFDTHLSKDFISFGQFEREIDAQSKAKELVDKFKINKALVKIYSNKQSFTTYPFLWQDFHTKLLQEAIDLGVIVQEKTIYKTIYKEIPKVNNSKSKPKIDTKKMILRNARAMSYKNLSNNQDDSLSYTEIGLVNQQEYEFEKEIKTKQGEIFVKVKDKNLYFSILDVEIKE